MSQTVTFKLRKAEKRLAWLEQSSSETYSKLKELRRNHKLNVSDHAIVRYQERVELLPPAEVMKKLTTEWVKKCYETLGDGIYPTGEGSTRAVIKDGVIVTVYI